MGKRAAHKGKGFFGETIYYDENYNEIGRTAKGFIGYDVYDKDLNKVGHATDNFWGGKDYYDKDYNKIGSENRSVLMGHNQYDVNHNKIGHSGPNMFGGETVYGGHPVNRLLNDQTSRISNAIGFDSETNTLASSKAINLDDTKSLTDYYEEYKREVFDVLNLTMDKNDADLNPDCFFRYFTIGLITQLVSRSTLHEAFKIRAMEDIFEQLHLSCDNPRALLRYPDVPEETITILEWSANTYTDPRNAVGWEMLLRGASTYSKSMGAKDKVIDVVNSIVNFLVNMEKYLADNNPNNGFGSMARIYCAYVLKQVVDEKITTVVETYSEPKLTTEEMKKRNDISGANLNSFIVKEGSLNSEVVKKDSPWPAIGLIIIIICIFIILL